MTVVYYGKQSGGLHLAGIAVMSPLAPTFWYKTGGSGLLQLLDLHGFQHQCIADKQF